MTRPWLWEIVAMSMPRNQSSDCCIAKTRVTGVLQSLRWAASAATRRMRLSRQCSAPTEERESAVSAHGHIKDEKTVETLSRVLKDENHHVRASTAFSLGRIGGGRAVELLLSALNDSSDGVRVAVAYALSETGDRRAVEPLERLLKREKSEPIRQQIEMALQQLKAGISKKQ